MSRTERQDRSAYRVFRSLPTRWMDNDVYGHVNNVVYYSFFDTAVNAFLLERRLLDLASGTGICLVVETACQYFEPIAFPDMVQAGLRIARMGPSSIRYEIGLFRDGADRTAAQGHFIHVHVDRISRRPTEIPQAMRATLAELLVPGA